MPGDVTEAGEPGELALPRGEVGDSTTGELSLDTGRSRV